MALSLFVLGSSAVISAQTPDPPKLLCANIIAGGDVELTWELPSGVQSDYLYRIYRDAGTGFFQLVDNLPWNSTSYIDNTVDPTAQSVQYRMQTYGNGTSISGNIVFTLLLNLLPSGSSIATLSWNSIYETVPTIGQYNIYRSIDGAAETQIANLAPSVTAYADTLFGLCDPDDPNYQFVVKYRVSYQRPECEMFSQVESGDFRDNLGPGIVDVETVTINPLTGFPEIYWYPITGAPDLYDYTIRAYINGAITPVGVVLAFQNTFFIYSDAEPGEGTTFQIIAHDSCGEESSYLNEYTTMMAISSYQECTERVNISWTPYIGWEEGVKRNRIYVNVDNAGFQLVDSVAANITSYQLEIVPNSEYCIYVEAVSNGLQRPSTTNATCQLTDYPQIIQFNYLNRVTTVDKNRIQIDLLEDADGQGTRYELFRASGSGPFLSMGSYNETNNLLITVFDTDVNADNTIYRYKWKAFDGCGFELAESNIGKNMILDAITSSENLLNTLNWTNYSTWDGGVAEYQIYRKTGSEDFYSYFASVGSDVFDYEEDITPFLEKEGRFCYKIVAVEGGNQYNSETTSESNEACVTQDPLMWIPNTIVLGGKNNVFNPVAGFIDFESYQMEIYNKWGQLIFSSDDINEGWRGIYGGIFVPEDYYRYIIVYRDGSGKSYLKQGVLYVLQSN